MGFCVYVCVEDRKKEDVVAEWAISGVDSCWICMSVFILPAVLYEFT